MSFPCKVNVFLSIIDKKKLSRGPGIFPLHGQYLLINNLYLLIYDMFTCLVILKVHSRQKKKSSFQSDMFGH